MQFAVQNPDNKSKMPTQSHSNFTAPEEMRLQICIA